MKGRGSQGQHKAKPRGFLFLAQCSTDQDEIDVLLKQFKLNILILFLSGI